MVNHRLNDGRHVDDRVCKQSLNDKVFILKEGAIETYVPLEKKGLSYMAYFCNAYFYDRILNQNFKEQRKELNQIMKIIFND